MMEYWNDVKERKTKILLNPTFHYSNCERSELRSGWVVRVIED